MSIFNLKQFVDKQICLACKGCCRFKEEKSIWRPKLINAERKRILENWNQDSIDCDSRIKSVLSGGQYICHFLEDKTSLCQIYQDRPFECALYPFVLVKEKDNVCVAAHLACPFIQEKKESDEFAKYRNELKDFFLKAGNKSNMIDLAQAYPGASQELEILFSIF